MQQISTGYLVCTCLNITLSICPSLSFLYCVHKSVLYVCISIAVLSRAAVPEWGFRKGTTGSSGRLSSGVREVRSPCVHELSQARILEWVSISASRGFPPPRDTQSISVGLQYIISIISTNFFLSPFQTGALMALV